MIPQEVADIIDILEDWFGSKPEYMEDYGEIANEIHQKVINPIHKKHREQLLTV